MIEALVSDIRSDARYRQEFDNLVLDRMDQSLTRAGHAEDPGPGPIERLVQSAGILSLSLDPVARREAFTIASATYELYGRDLGGLGDALDLVMSRLGNFPTINFLPALRERPSKLPTPALLKTTGRRIANTVETRSGEITLTDFQRSVWSDVSARRSVIASAPTSAGKSFLFQRHIADGLHAGTLRNAAVIVPRRKGAVPRCLIPRFDGAILSLEWKEAAWGRYVMGASRPRTPSEQQYSDRKLRSRR